MLDLSANNLTNFSGSPDGAIALSSAVSTHKNLTCLDLCHSRMSKAALSALVYGLRVRPWVWCVVVCRGGCVFFLGGCFVAERAPVTRVPWPLPAQPLLDRPASR